MSSIEIYYFTGSGNSLYSARELQKRLPGTKLTPIIRLLSQEVITTSAEAIGLVFPVHGMTLPIPVKQFLEKTDFTSAQYIFAVATRGGSKCLGYAVMQKLLKRKGKTLAAHFALNMANSDPKLADYEVPSPETLAAIEAEVQVKIEKIAEIVAGREAWSGKDDSVLYPTGVLFDKLILTAMRFAEFDGAKGYFYADSNCIGCGQCEKVCPSGKVKMESGRPEWQDNVKCALCYACLNFCPRQAAQIKDKWYMKSYTDKNGRYPHPYATAEDIAAQK